MVSLSERDRFLDEAQSEPALRPIVAYIFGYDLHGDLEGVSLDNEAISAIRAGDKSAFIALLEKAEKRQIGPTSTWFESDAFAFLLLVGCRQFDLGESSIERILDARERNPDTEKRRINRVLRSIYRREFSMEGEYLFVKAVYLHLVDRAQLHTTDALQVYDELVQPRLFSSLSQFLKVIAIKAYDLVLAERQPNKYSDVPALIQGFDELKDDFRARDLLQLLLVLRWKIWAVLISACVAIVGFAFGLGWNLASRYIFLAQTKELPTSLLVDTNGVPHSWHNLVLDSLESDLNRNATGQDRTKAIVVKIASIPTSAATKEFYVDVSNDLTQPTSGFGFKCSANLEHLEILQSQPSATGLRFLVPPSEPETRLLFLVLMKTPPQLNRDSLDGAFRLRVIP